MGEEAGKVGGPPPISTATRPGQEDVLTQAQSKISLAHFNHPIHGGASWREPLTPLLGGREPERLSSGPPRRRHFLFFAGIVSLVSSIWCFSTSGSTDKAGPYLHAAQPGVLYVFYEGRPATVVSPQSAGLGASSAPPRCCASPAGPAAASAGC